MSEKTIEQSLEPIGKGQKLGLHLQINKGVVIHDTLKDVIEYAQMMAKGGVAIPKHLRDQPGTCMAVIQIASVWGMDPWMVARKTYAVNDILSFEAQIIAAVIKTRAPIREKVIPYKFTGAGPTLQCSITLHHKETGEEITYESPLKKDIKPQNSPLWVNDERQQISYFSIKALARRHFPEVLNGVCDIDEAMAMAMKDVTPAATVNNFLNDEPHVEVTKPVATLGHDGTIVKMDISAGAFGTAYVGEVLPPVTMDNVSLKKNGTPITATDLKAGESYTFDPETGEIDEPAEPVAPEIIKANLLRQIASEDDKIKLEQWQGLQHEAINGLPPDMGKEVRAVLRARHEALEPF